ncbi:MAG: PAS domain-containing protein [Dehalococcoidia bacterium]
MSPPRSDPPSDDRAPLLTIARDDRDLLHAALAQAQAGIAIFDTDRRFIYVNQLLAQMNGQPAEAHLGRTLREVIPDLAPQIEPILDRALRGDRSTEQLSGPAPDAPSELRTWEVEYTPLRDVHGHIVGAMKIVRDRTQVHDAERRLSEAYAHLEAVFNTAPVSLSVWDRDLRLVAANKRMQRWSNIDPAQAVGRTLAEIAPGWRDGPINLRRALDGERLSAEIDRRALGMEMGPAHIQAWYAPVRLAGEVIGAVVASIDITARVERERAAGTAYAELEAVFAATPVALSMWDRNLCLIHANERWHEWTGVPTDGSAQVRADALAGPNADVVRERFRRALAGERFTVESDRRAQGHHGGPAWAQVSYAPVALGGSIIGVVIASVDITERVERARALDEAYAQMEAVFDAVPVGITVLDREFRIIHINDRMARWNDVDAASCVGRPGSEVFRVTWPVSAPYRERALGGEACELEIDRRALGATSGPAHVLASYMPVVVDGEVIGIVASSTDISERVEHAHALDEAYAQLEAIFDNVPVGIAVYDRDFRIVRINDEMARWNGLGREEAIGRLGAEVFGPTWSRGVDLRARALAGESTRFEVDRRGAGQQLGPAHVLTSYTPIILGGQVIGVTVSSTDISEGVERTRALAEAYGQMEAIFSASPVALAVWDKNHQLVRANALWREWNDIPLDQPVSIEDVSGSAREVILERFARALSGERFTHESDRRARQRARGPVWAEVSYAPVEVNGAVVGVVITGTDITDRVEHTRELQEAYAQLEAVFDNVQVGIAVYDRDFRIIRMNRQMAAWNGYAQNDVVGRMAAEVHTSVWPLAAEQTRRAMLGETTRIEIDRRAAGQRFGPAHVLAQYSPVRVDGRVIGITVSSTDISARVEAGRRSEAAIEFRDDLLSIASHELRTPLTSIIGFAERLERIAQHEQAPSLHAASEDLALIRGESQRMARTLDLLLDLVGLAAGAGEFEREPVAVAPLLRRQMRMVHERHPRLRLIEEFSTDLLIDSDADRIAQVVSNLLENAAKYAGDAACITVRTSIRRDRVHIEIGDDGPGIPVDQQRAVFGRRYRGHSAGTNGLGLGLYLSRMIAARLGGSLTLRSTPGEGATFTLALPVAATD